jgi:hypothetical protein
LLINGQHYVITLEHKHIFMIIRHDAYHLQLSVGKVLDQAFAPHAEIGAERGEELDFLLVEYVVGLDAHTVVVEQHNAHNTGVTRNAIHDAINFECLRVCCCC